MSIVHEITNGILDLIFPRQPYCLVCNNKLEPGKALICLSCENKVKPVSPPLCRKCGRSLMAPGPTTAGNTDFSVPGFFRSQVYHLCRDCRAREHYFVEARSFGYYEGVLRELIHRFKYGGRRELAEFLGGRMVQTLEHISWPAFDYIVPVPLHIKRERERGFNQAYLLAFVVNRHTGVPIFRGFIRIKPTEHQTLLDKSLREQNLTGAFEVVDKARLKGKTLLLIDDVYTTGSTADECSKTLINAGADSVFVLTCARG
ncbi:ComF family protein [Biomaibacter acetigenes]|uniref:ComF family protein n=1 Tax=Biomaibacter acetigenes TaxID=2316383 RepID=A0A3G2R474_9FIRM|nr:ComF family protein [Biomaibacter acetigenes]AYO29918.1 ComF family protein [Biomaibacter acetigenes]